MVGLPETLILTFLGKLRSRVRVKLAKSDTCPILICGDCCGPGVGGWFRAVFSASGDTTILYHSSGDLAQESCISGERSGF